MTLRLNALFALLLMLAIGLSAQASEEQDTTKAAKDGHQSRLDQPTVKVEKRGERNYVVGSLVIDAKPKSIWKILVDYNHAPEVFKNLKLCEVVGQRGAVKLIRQLVNTGSPIKFDYTVALVEKEPYSIEWSRDSGSLKEVTGMWLLEPLKSGAQTRVTYSIFIDGGMFLPPWLLTAQLKGYLPHVLLALRDKVVADIASNNEISTMMHEKQSSI